MYVSIEKSGQFSPGATYKISEDSSIDIGCAVLRFTKSHPEVDRQWLLEKLKSIPVEQFVRYEGLFKDFLKRAGEL